MLTQKILITLMGIMIALLAICKLDFVAPVTEGFWGGIQLGRKVQSNITLPSGQTVAMNGNIYPTPSTMSALGANKFVSVPSYQSMLSPRFSNINYGANIKYNLPDRINMAVPCDPLTSQSNKEGFMRSKENFESNPPSCGKGGYGMGRDVAGGEMVPPGYTNGNYQQVFDQASQGAPGVTGDIPIGDIQTSSGVGQDQVVAWNNSLMFASRPTSRALAHSDFIRGDLKIIPIISDNWSYHPNPSTDLNAGAMQAMNGDGSSNAETIALISASSGGKTTLGGVDLADHPYTANMAMQTRSNLSSASTDLTVTAFP